MQPANAAALPPPPLHRTSSVTSLSAGKKKGGKEEKKKPAFCDLRQEIKVTQAEDERMGGGERGVAVGRRR